MLRLSIRQLKLACRPSGSAVLSSSIRMNSSPPPSTAAASFTNLEEDEYDHMKTATDLKKSYATTSSEYHLVPNTIREIFEHSTSTHSKKMLYAFPHQGLNLTYEEMRQRVDLLTQNLLELGFKKGDRLAISLPNTHELVVTFLAASQIGIISVILNPAYQVLSCFSWIKHFILWYKISILYSSFIVKETRPKN